MQPNLILYAYFFDKHNRILSYRHICGGRSDAALFRSYRNPFAAVK
jgi:hypothetical protein